MTKLTRAPLWYRGGKWRIAPWVISHFPPHDCYVEPFGGAASVLLRKEPSLYEVYNDLDDAVVNFFRVLRTRPDDLVAQLRLTPWARRELELADRPVDDELESARHFFVRSWQSRRTAVLGLSNRTGWRFQKKRSGGRQTRTWMRAIEDLHLVAERMRLVQVECDHAERVLARYDAPRTLFYVDPPYVLCPPVPIRPGCIRTS